MGLESLGPAHWPLPQACQATPTANDSSPLFARPHALRPHALVSTARRNSVPYGELLRDTSKASDEPPVQLPEIEHGRKEAEAAHLRQEDGKKMVPGLSSSAHGHLRPALLRACSLEMSPSAPFQLYGSGGLWPVTPFSRSDHPALETDLLGFPPRFLLPWAPWFSSGIQGLRWLP